MKFTNVYSFLSLMTSMCLEIYHHFNGIFTLFLLFSDITILINENSVHNIPMLRTGCVPKFPSYFVRNSELDFP